VLALEKKLEENSFGYANESILIKSKGISAITGQRITVGWPLIAWEAFSKNSDKAQRFGETRLPLTSANRARIDQVSINCTMSAVASSFTYLPVSILDSWDVGFAERSLHETQYEGALADTACPKHDHAIVVTLFRHPDICRPGYVNPRHLGSLARSEKTRARGK